MGVGWLVPPPRRFFRNCSKTRKASELSSRLCHVTSKADLMIFWKFSGQVRSLTYDVIPKPLHSPRWSKWLISPEPSVPESRIRHQMTRNDEPVQMMCNMTDLHDCACMIAWLHANCYMTCEFTDLASEVTGWPRTLNLGIILFLLSRPTRNVAKGKNELEENRAIQPKVA